MTKATNLGHEDELVILILEDVEDASLIFRFFAGTGFLKNYLLGVTSVRENEYLIFIVGSFLCSNKTSSIWIQTFQIFRRDFLDFGSDQPFWSEPKSDQNGASLSKSQIEKAEKLLKVESTIEKFLAKN